MALETMIDAQTGRKCYLDQPGDLAGDAELTFLLSLHGGGSVGAWQREYFPAYEYCDALRLAIATPSAATREPTRHWAAEADDKYLIDLVEQVFERFGRKNIRSFWLVGRPAASTTADGTPTRRSAGAANRRPGRPKCICTRMPEAAG